MTRWNNLDDATLDTRTIYTGSYGFDNCDPIGKVWGHTPKLCEQAIRYSLAYMRAVSAFESEYQIRNSLWYVGPFAETVGDVIADMEEASRAGEMRDDIRSSGTGYVY